MLQLNLPKAQFRIKQLKDYYQIFDIFRNKYVKLTSEEWVRQHFLHYIVNDLGYPKEFLGVEKQIEVNGQRKRYDAVLFDNHVSPLVVFEFKAPDISISQEVFDQLAVYNSTLEVSYFMVSNGIEHYCCMIDFENKTYHFFEKILTYAELIKLNHK